MNLWKGCRDIINDLVELCLFSSIVCLNDNVGDRSRSWLSSCLEYWISFISLSFFCIICRLGNNEFWSEFGLDKRRTDLLLIIYLLSNVFLSWRLNVTRSYGTKEKSVTFVPFCVTPFFGYFTHWGYVFSSSCFPRSSTPRSRNMLRIQEEEAALNTGHQTRDSFYYNTTLTRNHHYYYITTTISNIISRKNVNQSLTFMR